MEEKKEIIKKLKIINDTYCESQSVLDEIENISVEDNYERKIEVPSKPDCPSVVCEPTKHYKTRHELLSNEKYFKKLPIGFGIASIIQLIIYFAAKSGINGSGSNADQIQTGFTSFTKIILFILIGVCASFLVCNLLKVIKVLRSYNAYIDSVDREFNNDVAKYNKYIQEKKLYNEKLAKYDEILRQHNEEEELISLKIREEETKLANTIKKNKYDPLIKRLEKENDGIVGEKYYPDLSLIIELLENGRSDSIKEAINLVEDIKFKERQLELEREKMEREEAARREEDERHQQEVLREERQREQERKERERRNSSKRKRK